MKMKLLGVVGAAAVIAAAGIYYMMPGAEEAPVGELRSDEPAIVALGEEIYAAQCAVCHGVELQGQPNWQTPGKDGLLLAPPHDETGHTWHHPDQLLFAVTKLGTAQALKQPDFKSDMPAFGETLSDDEIVAALSYIKSRWPEPVRKRHDTLNRRVKAAQGNR